MNKKCNLITSLLAILAVSGCEFERIPTPDGGKDNAGSRIYASLEECSSKITMGTDGTDRNKLSWSEEDGFRLFNDVGQYNDYMITDVSEGIFETSEQLIENPEHAFIPSAGSSIADGKLELVLPQSFVDKDAGKICSIPLHATVVGNNIQFKYMSGVLRLEFNNLPKSTVSILIRADKKISGTFSDVTVAGMMEVKASETDIEKDKTVEVIIADDEAKSVFNETVYVPIPTGNYGTIEIKAKNKAGVESELYILTDKTVARAKIYTVKRNLSELAEFKHPCAYVNRADIYKVRNKVREADESDPVYASWKHFCNNKYAQNTYTASPVEILVRGDVKDTGVESENYMRACRDAAAAFQLALRWQISEDKTYADAAVAILNAWAATCKRITANDNNQYLLAGFQGYQFANAAELLRDYTGWAAADQEAFKQWLLDVWYAKNKWFIDTHGGSGNCDLHYWSNWELANLASILAIGIYTENEEIVQYVKYQFTSGAGSGAINNMIPYAPVPDPDGKTALIAQSMESGRDQGHATLVVSMCAELCQMAYNVGMDFWGMENDKVLAMCEYTAKYNLKDGAETMPFTEYTYCTNCSCSNKTHGKTHTVISSVGKGTQRACWEMIYAHYSKVKGYGADKLYYTKKFAEQLRYTDGVLTGDGGAGDSRYGSNSGAFDQIGWGTLLFY